jgi:hypothetical protein
MDRAWVQERLSKLLSASKCQTKRKIEQGLATRARSLGQWRLSPRHTLDQGALGRLYEPRRGSGVSGDAEPSPANWVLHCLINRVRLRILLGDWIVQLSRLFNH